MLRSMQRDPLALLLELAHTYGEVARFNLGPQWLELVSHPDHNRLVLLDESDKFDKQSRGYDMLRPLLGNGLLLSEGDFWFRQRRLMQPAFHRQRLASFVQAMAKCTGEMLDQWEPIAKRRGTIDVAQEMMKLTLRIVSETLLGADVRADSGRVGKALTYSLHFAQERINSLFAFVDSLPTLGRIRFELARRTLDSIVLQTIRDHRTRGDTGDLLSMLLAARDEDSGQQMNDRQLRDEVMTIFLAGHETTAIALTWTWMLLSQHPDARRKVRDEARTVLGGRAPGVGELASLRYGHMVLQESMRLYPPVWTVGRHARQTVRFGEFDVPKGDIVFVSPYVMHRHPKYWPDAERFDPERFTPERAADLSRFVYMPFIQGPRKCIGDAFAMTEAQVVLAMVSQRYALERVSAAQPECDPSITLRARGGLQVRVLPA